MIRSRLTLASTLIAVAALGLAGCAASAPTASSAPSPSASSDAGSADGCAEVTVAVDFGPVDADPVRECVAAGDARDILDAAGVTTEGTADYGDQVVCRVNGLPSADEEVVIDGTDPFVETCATLNAAAYWALWVKNAPDAEWEYAQEGLATLVLEDGQSLGLVYTPGTDSTPPQD